MKSSLLPVLAILSLPLSQVSAQYNSQRGSLLGGLAGAAAGVAIGEHNDEPLAGALIGGAVGALTGAALGNTRDHQEAQNRAYQYQQRQQMQYQHQRQIARTVSIEDVIAMSRSGLSETVIINHIQANGVRHELQVADVIRLHESGVSQPVITAMQRPRPTSTVPATTLPAPVVYHTAPPIVVEPYVTPRYVYPSPRYYPGPRHHRHFHQSQGLHFSYRR